jgi:hypothetical protein
MSHGPLHLSADDFDALEASQELRARLASFARAAVLRIRSEGFGASVEVRNSGVRFVRDGAPPDALQLVLDLDAVGIEVSLRVPSAPATAKDFRNLRECARIPESVLLLTSLLEALPEPFAMGPSGEATAIAAPVSPDSVRAMLLRCEASGVPFWVGWSVPRDVAEKHADILDEELEDALLALVPVARFVSWDEDNDYLAPERPRMRAVDAEGDEDEDSPRQRQRNLLDHDEFEDEAPEPSVPLFLPTVPLLKSNPPPYELPRRFLRRAALVTEVDPSIPVEKGTRVRVLAGPFLGKVGVVQALDGRGRARVILGLLATTCAVGDLIAARERDRKPLGSSHRRFKRVP